MAKRPRELIGGPPPRGLESEIRRVLAPMLDQIRATLPRLRTPGDAVRLGRALRRVWSDAKLERAIRRVIVRAEQRASVGWAKWERIKATRDRRRDAADYDGEALIDEWTKQAVARISGIRDEVAERMRKDITAALKAGVDPAELADRWRREGLPLDRGTAEGRLRVIAQHQLASLHAQVQSARARALGVRDFVWHTQEDDRVREAHRVLHGRVFTYDDPPSEGLPGQPINCRCWAESVVPDEFTIPIGSAFDT